MPAYQNDAALSRPAVAYRPIRETHVTHTGLLVADRPARYQTLDAYLQMFAAPLASIPSAGLYQFSDPLVPSLRIIVHCEPVELCEFCHRPLSDCDEPF